MGRFQSSRGFWNQSVRTAGTAAGGACWTAADWQSKVVVLLDRASASSAEGVDILGRCLTSTEVPRKADMMWMAQRMIEAELSCGTLLLSHPKTRASLSVRRVTSLPIRQQHRNGRRRPTASRVEDLHPKAWSEASLLSKRKSLGKVTDAKNQTWSSSMVLMETAFLSPV